MSSLYSIDLMKELSDGFAQDGFTSEQVKSLRSHGRLRQIKAVLEGRAKIKMVEVKAPTPKKIVINRPKPFNSAEFLGAGWTIAEEDERSLALTELDITSVRLEHMLKSGEKWVKGEDKLTRLKAAGHVRLDAAIFLTLWQNQHLIPASWKELTNGNTTFIYFDGTILRCSSGVRCVLCLCWRDGQWYWDVDWLVNEWSADDPSAILAS